MLRRTLPVLAMLVLSAPAQAQRKPVEPPVRIYVGPLVKNGIVETDRGIEDTIKDIKGDLRYKKKEFRTVDTQQDAQIALIILGRGAGRDRGAVAAAAANVAIAVPIEGHVIDAVLKVGDYERPLRCEHEQWSECAEDLLEDVRAWLKANRQQLQP